MVSDLTTLFLGKPLAGSLPVLSAHSFASNRQLALLESAEDGKKISTKQKCTGREDQSRDRCLRIGHTTDRATAPGPNIRYAIYCEFTASFR